MNFIRDYIDAFVDYYATCRADSAAGITVTPFTRRRAIITAHRNAMLERKQR